MADESLAMTNVDNFIEDLKRTLSSNGPLITKFKNPVNMVMEGLNRLHDDNIEEVIIF